MSFKLKYLTFIVLICLLISTTVKAENPAEKLRNVIVSSFMECISLGFKSNEDIFKCRIKLIKLAKDSAISEGQINLAKLKIKIKKEQAEYATSVAESAEKRASSRRLQNSMSLLKKSQRMLSGSCTLGINC